MSSELLVHSMDLALLALRNISPNGKIWQSR